MSQPTDPQSLFDARLKAAKDAHASELKFQRLTRKLFKGDTGKEWLALAMWRFNFMGSVFSDADGMNAGAAAYRDGQRSVFSEILNASTAATEPEPD
jgi:hypothetical protein